MVDIVSLSVAIVAVVIALLSWWESRRHSELFQSMAKSLAYIARSRKVPLKGSSQSATVPSLTQQAEDRRRLKLELEREKENWRRQKEVGKALAWIIERLDEGE